MQGVRRVCWSAEITDFTLTAIGTVRSTRTAAVDDDWDTVTSSIELDATRFTPDALAERDLVISRVIFVFDRVDPSKVETGARHPRENPAWPRVGILAQRGRSRPNRLGTTICRIIGSTG